MKAIIKVILSILVVIGVIALAAIYISNNNIAVLEPKGVIGIKERDLIIDTSLLMLMVVVPAYLMAYTIGWKYRASNEKAEYKPDWDHSSLAEFIWWGVPFFIIVILSFFTWWSSHDLNPFRPIRNGKKPIVIQAVALNWKWLFIYPEHNIATVNYVQFPENTPVDFEITADAPMNGFWIPQLGGQIYAMPSMRTKLHLMASEQGTFRGRSSNISGKGFAGMTFTAQSTSPEEFRKWVASTKRAGSSLGEPEYRELVKPSEYDPVSLYRLEDTHLFDKIIDQYNIPPKE